MYFFKKISQAHSLYVGNPSIAGGAQEKATSEMLKHKFRVYFGIKSLDFHFSGELATLKVTIKRSNIKKT